MQGCQEAVSRKAIWLRRNHEQVAFLGQLHQVAAGFAALGIQDDVFAACGVVLTGLMVIPGLKAPAVKVARSPAHSTLEFFVGVQQQRLALLAKHLRNLHGGRGLAHTTFLVPHTDEFHHEHSLRYCGIHRKKFYCFNGLPFYGITVTVSGKHRKTVLRCFGFCVQDVKCLANWRRRP